MTNTTLKKIGMGIAIAVCSTAIVASGAIVRNVLTTQENLLLRLQTLEVHVEKIDKVVDEKVSYKEFHREQESHKEWATQVLQHIDNRSRLVDQRLERVESKIDQLLLNKNNL